MEDCDSMTVKEPDLMITECTNSSLDAELLCALSDSDYSHLPYLSWDDVPMSQLPHVDLFSNAVNFCPEPSSDSQEDSISDLSDPGSCYEVYPVDDCRDRLGYPSDPDIYACENMSCITYKQDTPSQTNLGPPMKKKPGRKKGQTSKVLHLWEFIRDLLKDPEFCGKIIKWENRAQGVFRVVQSSVVADLWGAKKKNKKAMTYEKMSRSMRYSRKEGYFVDLPKNSGYPKKLCFRFGPKSTGWQ